MHFFWLVNYNLDWGRCFCWVWVCVLPSHALCDHSFNPSFFNYVTAEFSAFTFCFSPSPHKPSRFLSVSQSLTVCSTFQVGKCQWEREREVSEPHHWVRQQTYRAAAAHRRRFIILPSGNFNYFRNNVFAWLGLGNAAAAAAMLITWALLIIMLSAACRSRSLSLLSLLLCIGKHSSLLSSSCSSLTRQALRRRKRWPIAGEGSWVVIRGSWKTKRRGEGR